MIVLHRVETGGEAKRTLLRVRRTIGDDASHLSRAPEINDWLLSPSPGLRCVCAFYSADIATPTSYITTIAMSQADFDILAAVASVAQKQQQQQEQVPAAVSEQTANISVLRDCPRPGTRAAPCAWLEGSCGSGDDDDEEMIAADMPDELPSLDALSDERLSLNDAFYRHHHHQKAASQASSAASTMAAMDSAVASLPPPPLASSAIEADVDMCTSSSLPTNPLHSMLPAGTWRFMCRDSNGRRGGVKAVRIWGRMGHMAADAVALQSIRAAADEHADNRDADEELSFCLTIKFYSCRSFQNRNAHYRRGRAAHVLFGAGGRCGFTLREVSSRNGMVSMNEDDGLDLAVRPMPPKGSTAAIDLAASKSSRPAFALSIDTQYELAFVSLAAHRSTRCLRTIHHADLRMEWLQGEHVLQEPTVPSIAHSPQARVLTSCQPCRIAKTRCDTVRPCHRCVRLNRADKCIDPPALSSSSSESSDEETSTSGVSRNYRSSQSSSAASATPCTFSYQSPLSMGYAYHHPTGVATSFFPSPLTTPFFPSPYWFPPAAAPSR